MLAAAAQGDEPLPPLFERLYRALHMGAEKRIAQRLDDVGRRVDRISLECELDHVRYEEYEDVPVVRAYGACRRQAVEPSHFDIEKDDVGVGGVALDNIRAVVKDRNVECGALLRRKAVERFAQKTCVTVVVLHYADANRIHTVSSRAAAQRDEPFSPDASIAIRRKRFVPNRSRLAAKRPWFLEGGQRACHDVPRKGAGRMSGTCARCTRCRPHPREGMYAWRTSSLDKALDCRAVRF